MVLASPKGAAVATGSFAVTFHPTSHPLEPSILHLNQLIERPGDNPLTLTMLICRMIFGGDSDTDGFASMAFRHTLLTMASSPPYLARASLWHPRRSAPVRVRPLRVLKTCCMQRRLRLQGEDAQRIPCNRTHPALFQQPLFCRGAESRATHVRHVRQDRHA